jgi:type I restriction enzyme, S subunit
MSEGNGLPKGWGAVSLADLTAHRPICYGVLKPGPRQTRGIPLIRITDISADVVDESDIYLITERLSQEFSRSVLQGGEVLLSIQGTIGRTAICPKHLAGANVSRTLAVIDPDERVTREFLRFWLLSRNGRFPVCGSTRASLNIGVIRELPAPLPPLPEQHRIVEKIEELFSDLDAGVASLQRAKANLKRYRASVLKSAVEGRLTEEWRKEHPQTEDGQMLLDRILRERREKWEKDQLVQFRKKGKEPPKNWQSKYEEPSAPDASELLELPEGWVWATIEQFAYTATGGTPDRKNPDYFGGGIPWVKSGELGDGHVYATEETLTALGVEESNAKVFPKGTLCIALYGATVGKLGILEIDATTNQAVCGIFLPDTVKRAYLFQYLTLIRPQLIEQGKGGAQSNISNGLVRQTVVPLPPLAEQEQIVALVEERLSQIDSAEKTINAELIRTKRLRQSILKRAFEGNLVPQDPRDEPASVVLERIKASREAEQPKKKAKKVKAK